MKLFERTLWLFAGMALLAAVLTFGPWPAETDKPVQPAAVKNGMRPGHGPPRQVMAGPVPPRFDPPPHHRDAPDAPPIAASGNLAALPS